MFTGYSDKVGDFFWELRFNNSREWFNPRKEEFNQLVMQPTKALANELYDWFQEQYPALGLNLHISRIYRDARRLFGRGPLKDEIWFSFQNEIEHRDGAPNFWFEVGAEGYGLGFGYWMRAAECASSSIRTPSRWKSWRDSLPDRTCSHSPARNTRSRRGMRTTSSARGTTSAGSASAVSGHTMLFPPRGSC
mgnify:CR=1 FL=1